MADKEPRRRKKRRDSQKKDDVRQSSEDQFFASLKSESRDSDPEVEEEPVSHSHHGQPSNFAKVVFIILFSGLVVSLSFIFISLRDVDRGPVDIFDAGHGEHHGEALHEEHLEEVAHDDHHHHEESEVTIDDFIPGLSSIFSFNDEVAKDIESPEIPVVEEDKEHDDRSHDAESESSEDQGILEEYVEDTSMVNTEESVIEEPFAPEVYPETITPVAYTEDMYLTVDYSEAGDYITPNLPPDKSSSETSHSDERTDTHIDSNHASEEILPVESLVSESDDIPTTLSPENVDEQDSFMMYEKADITNEIDYDIREELDELDDIVAKDSDNYIQDDDISYESNHPDEEEEIDEEEGVEEEFDFWQF